MMQNFEDMNNIASSIGGAILAVARWIIGGRDASALKMFFHFIGAVVIGIVLMPFISRELALTLEQSNGACFIIAANWPRLAEALSAFARNLLVKK